MRFLNVSIYKKFLLKYFSTENAFVNLWINFLISFKILKELILKSHLLTGMHF